MHRRSIRPVVAALAFAIGLAVQQASAVAADAVLFRLFLLDGSSIVSYGEFARVADRVVVTIPIGDAAAGPNLQLVSIAESAVDWEQTNRYTHAVRAKRYAETRGEDDYALLGQRVSQALNDLALTADPARRLAMAEEARRNLVQWPGKNFGYRAAEVGQLAALFDEVISDLRVAAGRSEFDLNLVATTVVSPAVDLLPAPDAHDVLQQAFNAARLTGEPSERQALLRAITAGLAGRVADDDRAAVLYAEATSALASELRVDKAYRDLSSSTITAARTIAARADVRGLQALIEKVLRADDKLGRLRQQETASLMALIDLRLDEARRLRLARDAWVMRVAALGSYRRNVTVAIGYLQRSRQWLDDIKQLAGPSIRALDVLEQRVVMGRRALAAIDAPPEVASAHSMFGAAFQMARRAASTRRGAVASGDMKLAWDASSAAAGAVMLLDNAMEELTRLSVRPDSPQALRPDSPQAVRPDSPQALRPAAPPSRPAGTR